MSKQTQQSKFLSLVLRHQPNLIGIKLDKAGWVNVAELLNACDHYGHPMTISELESVVVMNNKKRFEYSKDGTMIRASQGHSVQVDLGYEKKTPPEILYHGTASISVPSIIVHGIRKESRHHVHLSSDQATAIKVGERHGESVVLLIAAGDMHKEGIPFYLSTNGVWLTDYVDPKFVKYIEGVHVGDYGLQLKEAEQLSETLHRGQFRKFGVKEPYVNHPKRVSERCNGIKAKIVAHLHDTLEDTSATEAYLREMFFPDIVDAVVALSRRKDENYFDFIKRVCENEIAKEVKWRDLEDNMRDLDEGSLKDKYRFAKNFLETHI